MLCPLTGSRCSACKRADGCRAARPGPEMIRPAVARAVPIVPAWQLAVSEYSLPDYVFVLSADTEDRFHPGEPETKLVHRLTPVRPAGASTVGRADGIPTVTFR